MERETYFDGTSYVALNSKSECVQALGAYEDTRLKPEEITRLCAMDKRAKMAGLLRLEEYKSVGPVEDFRALKEAEEKRREGCEYCQAGAEIQHYFEIREEYGGHELYGYDKFGDECSANIYFCPICGRNLRGGSHDGDSGSRPSL